MSFYDAWQRPPDDEPAPPGSAPATGYAQAAFEREVGRVATAANHTRNHALNTSALKLYRLVEGGALDEATVTDGLRRAYLANTVPRDNPGLRAREAKNTLRSAREAARGNPREVPEREDLPPNLTVATHVATKAKATGVLVAQAPEDDTSAKYLAGAAFVIDVPATVPAIWGDGNDVLWAEGESVIIAGPQGVGKTTLALQLMRARLGLEPTKVLGFPVQPGRKVLWLAMDRPAQARRAAHRLFHEHERQVLDERLVVWPGPPPGDLAKHPGLLVHMAQQVGADTVMLDSLKDAATGLSEDAVGAGYNRCRQNALVAGIQLIELHHQVKRGAMGGAPNTLADLYGSVWVPAGAGSVLLLWGEAGDPIVAMRHLKQPMEEVGPFQVLHDHALGTSEVVGGVDLLDTVRLAHADGLTAAEAAVSMFETQKPTRSQTEKARRKLDRLVTQGLLRRMDGARGGAARTPARYFLGGLTGGAI